MNKTASPWKRGALFICEKCGRRSDGPKVKDGYAGDLKHELKGRLKDAGFGKDIRVMTSSCLSLCTKGKQVVAFSPAQGALELLEYDAPAETEQVLAWLLKK